MRLWKVGGSLREPEVLRQREFRVSAIRTPAVRRAARVQGLEFRVYAARNCAGGSANGGEEPSRLNAELRTGAKRLAA